jgi:hypothetical protein
VDKHDAHILFWHRKHAIKPTERKSFSQDAQKLRGSSSSSLFSEADPFFAQGIRFFSKGKRDDSATGSKGKRDDPAAGFWRLKSKVVLGSGSGRDRFMFFEDET